MSRGFRNEREESSRTRTSKSASQSRPSALATSRMPIQLKVIIGIFIAIAVIFFARLIYLQVIVADEYSAMAAESRTVSFTTSAHRGTIYDRNGVVLAMSVDATTVYCNPSEITDVDATAEQIAAILGGEAADYVDALTKQDTSFAYIMRQADVDMAAALKECNLEGVYFIADSRREYPNGAIGGQVIGYCNIDGEGITGLELQYNDILSGTPGTYSAERGADGTPIPGGVYEDVAAIDGNDIIVSLDIKLQDAVEQALASGAADLGTASGNSVIMDAQTGEIYAICSLPYMDPTNMEDSPVGSDNLTAITQAFEPGSDFKTVAALAIIESGTMTTEDTIYCPESLQADEYIITDSHSRSGQTMSLRQIVAESSNIGISLATAQMGFENYYNSIVRYGLNSATGVDFPGESAGYLPEYSSWSRVASYNICFGQGISVTPLQMTRFYAMIANDGVQVTPHFLISLPQTGEYAEYESTQVVTDTDAVAQVESMLRSVVTDGTGTDADIEGFEVVGKTSTAEVAKNGSYVDGLYNLCFVGYLNNSSSSLVCFVSANEVGAQKKVTSIFREIITDVIETYNVVPE